MSKRPLDTPEALARLFVRTGYPRQECIDAILRDFPDADAEALVDAEAAAQTAEDAELQHAIEQAERAIDAEHNTSKTMHEEDVHDD